MDELYELPAWAHSECDERGILKPVDGKAVWSHKDAPPAIGDRVTVRFGGGPGTVRSYFVSAGYLGVNVELDRPKKGPIVATVFGREIL